MDKYDQSAQIAAQLRRPHGEYAMQVADAMCQSNELIVKRMYDHCALENGKRLLEIGMANAPHLEYLLQKAEIHYSGFDYATEMVEAAKDLHQTLVADGKAAFLHGDIDDLPFESQSFDLICSANTLYFWPRPLENTHDLYRVLQPKGQLVLAIRTKAKMQHMPAAAHGFTLYAPDEAVALMTKAGFVDVSFAVMPEPSREVMGQMLEIDGCYLVGSKG